MKLALVILSDMHFASDGPNPPLAKSDQIAAAVSSSNVQLDGLVIILAGDIANGGTKHDYEIAASFTSRLEASFLARYPSLKAHFLMVPGNHDCLLPKEEIEHRKSQVDMSIRTLMTPAPDPVFITHLLKSQDAYWSFAADRQVIPPDPYGRVCWNQTITVGDAVMHFNFFNTALCSQYYEDRGKLYVPVNLFSQIISPAPSNAVTVSVFHHPLQWIEPDTMLQFRHFLNRTCDLIITGHQHKGGSFYQSHDTGERVHYYESPALYDRKNILPSGFRVVTIDFASLHTKDCKFESDGHIYRPKSNNDSWHPLLLNDGIRTQFTLAADFQLEVTDPGVAYIDSGRRRIALSELFVYPDLKAVGKNGGIAVKGSSLADTFLSRSGIYLIQGEAFAGKTALAKSLFTKYFVANSAIPVLIDATQLRAASASAFEKRLIADLHKQYADLDIEVYRQLSRSQRVVIIDNWHKAHLSNDQRLTIYEWLQAFATTSILFTDPLYDLKQIVSTTTAVENVVSSDELITASYQIVGLGHVGRGELIHNWLALKSESTSDSPDTSKDSKATEDTITRLLRNDSLPPYAFFIVCLLQARESHAIDSIASGSFGRLYEVLVTSALNKGDEAEQQIDRKAALLSEIAAFMWRNKLIRVNRTQIQEIANNYTEHFSIELRVDTLLRDLETARVLVRDGSTYHFSYGHFFYYFVALYIRDRIDDDLSGQLLNDIDHMIDHISLDINAAIIMFLIHFAKEKKRIIARIIDNATQIYADVPPLNMEKDAAPFVNKKEGPELPSVTGNDDIAEARRKQREHMDAAPSNSSSLVPIEEQDYSYSSDLTDVKKLHLADRSIDALGQIIRNFSVTLPLETKLQVLVCTYELGFRTMARVMRLLAVFFDFIDRLTENEAAKVRAEELGLSLSELKAMLEKVGLMTGKLVAITYLRKMSSGIGVAEMEQAYRKAMATFPVSTASRLLEVTIEMDHFNEFPEAKVEKLDEDLRNNPFAHGVMHWLVGTYLMLNKVDRSTRQRMATMLSMKDSTFLKSSIRQG